MRRLERGTEMITVEERKEIISGLVIKTLLLVRISGLEESDIGIFFEALRRTERGGFTTPEEIKLFMDTHVV